MSDFDLIAERDDQLVRALALALIEVRQVLQASGRKMDSQAAAALIGRVASIADQLRNQAAARHNVYSISGADRGKPRPQMDAERRARMHAADLLADAADRAERYFDRLPERRAS